MARIHIKSAQQIERINKLINQLSDLNSTTNSPWMQRPHEKAWSAIEVVKHIVIAHTVYVHKIDTALAKLQPQDAVLEDIKSTLIPSMLIKRFPPKQGRIRFKMKTMKQFEPMLDMATFDPINIPTLLNDLKDVLNQLKTWIKTYRPLNVKSVRFNSAVGPTVRFNVAEACEFILCHNERHFQQIKNALALSTSTLGS